MSKGAFTAVLAELFAAHGWNTTQDAALEGRSGTVYGAPVLAESDHQVLLVERRGPQTRVARSLVEEMERVVADTGADAGLLVHLGPVEPAAREACRRIMLWDHETTSRLIGETRLAVVADAPMPRLPLDVPTPGPGTGAPDLDAFEAMDPATEDEAPILSLEDLMAAPSVTNQTLEPQGPGATYPVLVPRFDPAQAAAKVRDRLFSAAPTADLVLQPVHLIDFEVDLLVEGSLDVDTVEGRVEVHGTTKTVRDVDPLWADPERTGEAPEARSVDERTLRIDAGRAIELAHSALLKSYTRIVEIETTDDDEDFVIMERKDVTPRPDQVRLVHLGIVHRPHWRLRGSNGACLVDAITGDVVGEELRMADPDIMILD